MYPNSLSKFRRRRQTKKKGLEYKEVTAPVVTPLDLRRGGHIVPASVIVTLKYTEGNAVAPGIAYSDYQYNLNSIFDPNRTGTGHQPLGFDQWATFYNRYRVDAVDVLLEIQNTGTNLIKGALVGSNNTSAYTENGLEEDFGFPYSIGGSSGIDMQRVACSFRLNKITGKPIRQYRSDDTYSALFSGSPTETIVLHVLNIANTGNVAVNYNISLTFHVCLYDKLDLSQS